MYSVIGQFLVLLQWLSWFHEFRGFYFRRFKGGGANIILQKFHTAKMLRMKIRFELKRTIINACFKNRSHALENSEVALLWILSGKTKQVDQKDILPSLGKNHDDAVNKKREKKLKMDKLKDKWSCRIRGHCQ